MRVIIVDDHRLVRDGIRWMLVNEPTIEIVGEAGGGDELLTMLDEVTVDVILLDVRMPGMSGFEVLQELDGRSDSPRVLALSMYDEPAMVRQAIVLGAGGYINKSAGREDLIEAIHIVGRGEHYLPSDLVFALVPSLTSEQQDDRQLSTDDAEILRLVAEGMGNRQIAARLSRSEASVRDTLHEIYGRLGVHNRSEAVAVALRLGVLD